jgi:hypothetical protein
VRGLEGTVREKLSETTLWARSNIHITRCESLKIFGADDVLKHILIKRVENSIHCLHQSPSIQLWFGVPQCRGIIKAIFNHRKNQCSAIPLFRRSFRRSYLGRCKGRHLTLTRTTPAPMTIKNYFASFSISLSFSIVVQEYLVSLYALSGNGAKHW